MRLNVNTLITTPVIKTKRRLGSQFWSSCKNPKIFVLWVIPAIISPHPKTTPTRNRIIFAISDFSFSEIMSKIVPTKQSPRKPSAGIDNLSTAGCLSQGNSGIYFYKEYVAVSIPVARKVRTAVNDRVENLGSPQSPCPLVHPLARSVPKPTNNPATTKCVTEVYLTKAALSKGRVIKVLSWWNLW